MDTTSNPVWALLIGIDCYMPNITPLGSYPHLSGCVSDVRRIKRWLESKHSMLNLARVITLTATGRGVQPVETPDQWPTYDNIVAALKTLLVVAQPGDHVYIHYSGHGSRVKTIFPELKSAGGYDEGLVPTDIGSCGRYLRDVELAYLLQQLVDKQLRVTITLDSCHSGGAVRAVGVQKRGVDFIDDQPDRPQDSHVASHEDLEATWRRLQGGPEGMRSVKLAGGWLPPQMGYTLFAACGEAEFANEYTDDDGIPTGALTKFFLEGCKHRGPGFTNKMLLDRILAGIHGRYPNQTPQLQGDGAHVVFGIDTITTPDAVAVLRIESQRVQLNVGQESGLAVGAKFAIYPSGTLDFTVSDARVALAELTDLGVAKSWASLTLLNHGPIEPDAQAVLLTLGNLDLVRKVGFVIHEAKACAATTSEQGSWLDKVGAALQQDAGRAWLELVTDRDADFQVALSEDGKRYEIWDRAGVLIPLRPNMAVNGQDMAAKIVEWLIHLTKYRNVQELQNYDMLSALDGKLRIELLGKQCGYIRGVKSHPVPFEDPNRPVIQHGEYVFVRMTNLLPPVHNPQQPWRNTLNVTLFDLAPDWSITQVFPPDDSPFFTLSPGLSYDIPLRAWLPEGYNYGTDVLKVFATEGTHTTSFRWFALPALDQPSESKARSTSDTMATSGNPLQSMLASVAGEKPMMRNVGSSISLSRSQIQGAGRLTVETVP